jgi:ABC-type Fe3+ transport system permease subunit
VITTAIAVPLAFALARLPVAGRSALLALVVLPLVLPSFVYGLCACPDASAAPASCRNGLRD